MGFGSSEMIVAVGFITWASIEKDPKFAPMSTINGEYNFSIREVAYPSSAITSGINREIESSLL